MTSLRHIEIISALMLIALAGRIGAGKTFIAHALATHYDAEVMSFATKLKRMVAMMDTSSHLISDTTRDKSAKMTIDESMTYGRAYQVMGQALRNAFGRDVWARALFACQSAESIRWIIDDLRFVEELDAVVMRGGIVVWIDAQLDDASLAGRDPHDESESYHSILREKAHLIYRNDRCSGVETLIAMIDAHAKKQVHLRD